MTEKSQKTISWYHPAFLVATWFGIGKIPFAPGTWGSFFTFPLFFASFGVIEFANSRAEFINIYLALVFVLYLIGNWTTNIYMKHTGRHDPKEVVIDEVVGQILVLFAGMILIYDFIGAFEHIYDENGLTQAYLTGNLQEINILHLGAGVPVYLYCFALFRLFDIWKPWPIRYCDLNIKGGFGVMFDDIFAAVYAIIVLYLTAMIWFA